MKERRDIYIEENGIKYRKGYAKTGLFGYAYNEYYYPVADDDPTRFLILTILLGWLGVHKYITGEYAQGLLYTLTFGGFGFFYVFDVISICTGNYYVLQTEYIETDGGVDKQKCRIYLDKIPSKRAALLGVIISILLSFAALTAYVRVMETVGQSTSSVTTSTFENMDY